MTGVDTEILRRAVGALVQDCPDSARVVVADQLARSTLLADNLRVKSKVHPKYKTKYHGGNWPEYEQALVSGGQIFLDVQTVIPIRWLLVIIRIVQGPMWMSTGWYWLTADTTGEMLQQISRVIESGRTYEFFVPFLEDVVLPYIPDSLRFSSPWALVRRGDVPHACLYGNTLLPIGGNWLDFCYLIPVLIGAAGEI